jgi:hypothetical protein
MAISAIQASAWKQALTARMKTHRFDRIHWPPSYFPVAVTSDASYWTKGCVARYQGLASVSCSTCDPPQQTITKSDELKVAVKMSQCHPNRILPEGFLHQHFLQPLGGN